MRWFTNTNPKTVQNQFITVFIWKEFLKTGFIVLLCTNNSQSHDPTHVAPHVASGPYIWRRLVLDRLLDVRFFTSVFGWGMIGWGGRAGIWGRWAGLWMTWAGLCGGNTGLWCLVEREVNFFFPPSSESVLSSSVRSLKQEIIDIMR